ncbi:MAG: hypothetical protein Q4C13_07510 [Clostridia bacterium]|nr:hypothetical protein [Clostridia bacterium]
MEEKEKRFLVSLTIRFPSTINKVMFVLGLAALALAAAAALYSLVTWTGKLLGAAIVVALLGAIWLFVCRSVSESVYGSTLVSFGKRCMRFYTKKQTYELDWDDCVVCGIRRSRWANWVYASDHELREAELVEFPENVEPNALYFGYQKESFEEFMKYVPERFREGLNARKAELKIK